MGLFNRRKNPDPEYFPNLTGHVDPTTELAIRNLYNIVSGLQSKIPPEQLTIAEVRAALSAGGVSPLNLTGLPGLAAQPQHALVPVVSGVPSQFDPLSQPNTLVSVNGLLYRLNEPTQPGVWKIQQALGVTLVGTAAQRLSTYPAADYLPGTLFYASDTHTLYVDLVVGGVNTWVVVFSSVLEDVHQARISAGNMNYSGGAVTRVSGSLFFSGMIGHQIALGNVLYTVLTYVDPNNITVSGLVGSGSLSFQYEQYPAVDYPTGTMFYELDRRTTYITIDANGTVNTSGVNVSYVSGVTFNPYWVGKQILINGTYYTIATVPSPGSMTLTTSAGTQTGVLYVMFSGRWTYQAGHYRDTLANIPVDLGGNDIGFLFLDATYRHSYIWVGAGWNYAPGDPGAGYICARSGGSGWALCDGSTVLVAQGDGTMANTATPDLTGDVFLKGGTPEGTQEGATSPTWDSAARTETEDAHIHSVNIPGSPSFGAGAFDAYPGGIVATGAGTPHAHDLTDTNAILNPPSEGDGGLPLRIRLAWYIRQ